RHRSRGAGGGKDSQLCRFRTLGPAAGHRGTYQSSSPTTRIHHAERQAVIEPAYGDGVGTRMMKRFIIAAALLPASMLAQTPATSARTIPPSLPIDRVVAIVGDQPLLWSDVLTAVNQRRAQGLQLPPDSAG